MKNNVLLFSCFIFILQSLFIHECFSGEHSLLQQGINQYNDENYEQAIPILIKARQNHPKSPVPAFFLGMAYKQSMDYEKAAVHLRDAVSMDVKIKEAVVELIDVLSRLPGKENLNEAENLIKTAEKNNIFPAKICFLKGHILAGKGMFSEATACFQKVKKIDANLGQSADFQTGLIYLKMQEPEKALSAFESVENQGHDLRLAETAETYKKMIKKQVFNQKPLHFNMRLTSFYDTNMVLKPTSDVAAQGITNEKSFGMSAGLTADYQPRLNSPWNFNCRYSFYGSFHENHGDTHDVIANSLALVPGYDFGDFNISIISFYSNFLLGKSGYERYMDYFNIGPVSRVIINRDNILELFAGYNKKKFFQEPSIPEENRDSDSFKAYASWRWRFWKKSFMDLQYEFTHEQSKGENWENKGHRISIGAKIPFADSFILNLRMDEILQYYDNVHPLIDSEREDHTNIALAELTWNFMTNTDLILNYSRSRDNSNVGIYDYKRQLVSLGLEYRF